MVEARPGDAPTVLRIVLGARLRRLRERAGLGYEQAARILDVNQATVRRMEKAETGLKLPYLEKLLAAYGAPDEEAARFLELAREANRPGWWSAYRDVLTDWSAAYIGLEGAADRLRGYAPHQIPDLLQTEGYAAAALAARHPSAPHAEIARRVQVVLRRQELWQARSPAGPVLWTVLEEAALRRPVGGPRVMRDQLDRLIEAAGRHGTVLQVIPLGSGPHPAMLGPFAVFRLQVPEIPDVVFAEHLAGAAYFDDERSVAVFRAALDAAAVHALPAARSTALLQRLRAAR